MQVLEKCIKIRNFINLKRNSILFFKYNLLRLFLLNWQKRFIKKTFLFLYFWYIYIVKNASLKKFYKYYKIFFSYFLKNKKEKILKLFIKINRRKLLFLLFFFKIFLKRRRLLKFFEKYFLKNKIIKKNKKLLLKFYYFLRNNRKKKQRSKKYKLNKINNLFILFNLYFLERCFFFFHKTFSNIWNLLLNSDKDSLYLNNIIKLIIISNEKHNCFKKQLCFLNVFNKFIFKNIAHLKSFYYKTLKIKKTILTKNKKKPLTYYIYKRKYKYYQLLFKMPISIV